MSRIAPTAPPYAPDVAARLDSMMPPGTPPIALFRTFVRNMPMTDAMRAWGGYELSKQLSLTMRDREVLIDRTCARCECEYEWGVHVAFFAERVGLTAAQVTSLAHGGAHDACWTDRRDRLLIRAADGLHDRADIDDDLWAELAGGAQRDRAPRPDDAVRLVPRHQLHGQRRPCASGTGRARFADVARDIVTRCACTCPSTPATPSARCGVRPHGRLRPHQRRRHHLTVAPTQLGADSLRRPSGRGRSRYRD